MTAAVSPPLWLQVGATWGPCEVCGYGAHTDVHVNYAVHDDPDRDDDHQARPRVTYPVMASLTASWPGPDAAPMVHAVEAARRADVAIELARRALLGRGDVAELREVLAAVVDVLADGVVPEVAGPVVEVDGTVVPWAGEGPAPASSRVAAYLRRVGVDGG